MEGISRRIYNPLHASAKDRIGAVCEPPQLTQQCAMTNNNADQRTVLPLVSVAFAAWTSALFGLPENLVERSNRVVVLPRSAIMLDDHRPAMLQVTAVDDRFGTHRA